MNDVTRKSDTWLALHRATLGGSNSAAAVGLSPYKSRLSLFYELINGTAQDLSTNPDVLRGLLLEPVARQRLRDVLNLDVIDHDQDDFIRSTRYHWAHALPDGWVLFDGARLPIELKVPNPRNWELLDVAIPDYISCQCVHNAAVIGAPALLLIALNPVSMEIYRNIYTPDPDAVAALMEAEERFWNDHIVPRIPPPPISNSDIKLRWPISAADRIDATIEIEEAHAELMPLKEDAKKIEARIDEISLRMKLFMEDRESLISSGGHVLATHKSHTKAALDTKRLRDEAPVIYTAYSVKTNVRVFLPKKSHEHM